MKRHLLFSLFTLLLLTMGGVNVAVKAEATQPTDTEKYPLTISGAGICINCESWADLKTKLSEAQFQNYAYLNIDVWRDINGNDESDSFGQWVISSTTQSRLNTLVLRIQGHKIKGTSITVDRSNFEFRIYDSSYQPVDFVRTSPFSIINNNTGCISLTGQITATKNNAQVVMESGCVFFRKWGFEALGDYTGQSDIHSQIIIKGGYIKAIEGSVLATGKGAEATVDGNLRDAGGNILSGAPVLESLDNAAVMGDGSNTDNDKCGGTTITLGQGVFIGRITSTGYAACGVYHPQEGTLNIGKDAYIVAVSDTKAAAGVVMRGGKLNMTGGTILADGVASASGRVGDSRVVVPSSGIVFDPDANYYDHANVNIDVTDGTISGNHSAVELINTKGNYTQGQIELTGGTYSSDIAEYIPTGYGSSAESKEGKYTVSNEEVAQAIDADGVVKRYSDLKAVLEQYAAGKTVKLMKDVTLTSGDNDRYDGIDVAQGNVTFDLNSHMVTGELNSYVIGLGSNTNLTIIDSSTNGGGKIQSNKANCPIFYAISSDEEEGTAGSLTIKGGTFVSSAALIYRHDDASAKEWTETVNVLNGNYDVPRFNSGEATGLVGNFLGGYYTDAFHTNETAIVSRGYSWVENDNKTYPWRIRSDVYYTTEKGKWYLNRDENDRYVIALNENDGEPLTGLVVGKDVENVNVTVRKHFFTANEWNAFYAPFDLKVTDELLEKFEIAKIWDTELKWDGETPQTTIEFIKLKSGAEIPAFTPCMILAKEFGTQSITAENVTLYNTTDAREAIDCSTVEQKFTFTGVLTKTNIYDKYALADGALVHATNENASLSPFKFFMTITDRKSGKEVSEPTLVSIRVIGDETNGISEVNDAATRLGDGKVYNLQGTFVGTSLKNLPAGIYVQNGRKYVVK